MSKVRYKINYNCLKNHKCFNNCNCFNNNFDSQNPVNMTGGGKKATVILFKTDWCGACNMFKQSWNELQEMFKDNDEVKFKSINCEKNREIANLYNIEYYPTLVLKNKHGYEKYDGSRRPFDLKQYIKQNMNNKFEN